MTTTRTQYNEMFDFKALVKRSLLLIVDCMEKGTSIKAYSDRYRAVLNGAEFSKLLRSERLRIYNSGVILYRQLKRHVKDGKWATVLSRPTKYDTIYRQIRRAAAQSDTRDKLENLHRAVEAGYIFFICSEHEKCADGHKQFQGKLFVDRAWRSHIKADEDVAVLVKAFIAERNIPTFQSVLFKPHWLITRPYCRHWLIPIPTDTVLEAPSLNILRRRYAMTVHPFQADFAYDEFRKEVFEMLNAIYPHPEFNVR